MFWFTFLLYNISSYFQTVGPTRIQGQSITSHPVMFLFVSPLTDNLYQIKEEGDLLLVFDFRNSYLMGCCMPLFWCHASAFDSSWSAWCLELTSFLFIEIMAARCSEVSAELLAAVWTGLSPGTMHCQALGHLTLRHWANFWNGDTTWRLASNLSQSMLQSNVTAAKVLEEQEFGVILISPSFQLSLSFLENQEFKSVCILALVNYCAEHCIDWYCHRHLEEIQLKWATL